MPSPVDRFHHNPRTAGDGVRQSFAEIRSYQQAEDSRTDVPCGVRRGSSAIPGRGKADRRIAPGDKIDLRGLCHVPLSPSDSLQVGGSRPRRHDRPNVAAGELGSKRPRLRGKRSQQDWQERCAKAMRTLTSSQELAQGLPKSQLREARWLTAHKSTAQGAGYVFLTFSLSPATSTIGSRPFNSPP